MINLYILDIQSIIR